MSSKAVKRQTVQKAVVPAIPLPYLRKRKQQLAPAEPDNKPSERLDLKEKHHELGGEARKVQEVDIVAAQPSPLLIETTTTQETQTTVDTLVIADSSSDDDHDSEAVGPSTSSNKDQYHSIRSGTILAIGGLRGTKSAESTLSMQEAPIEPEPERKADLSDPSTSTSRSAFHMPPAFVPASQTRPNITTGHVSVPSQNTLDGQQQWHQIHQAHPSTGSLVFGGYPESNNSSPAPPVSAGNVPPHPYQSLSHSRTNPSLSDGRPVQHIPNGYTVMGPLPPPSMHQQQEKLINNGLGLENYVQSQVAHGVMDNYSPSPTPFGTDNSRPATYDPPTPHSFHGSQSPAINEQESGFHSQHIHTGVPKERNGIVEDGRTYPYQPRPHPANNTNIPPPSRLSYPIQGPADVDHYDGLVFYLQSQFSDCEFADWELELRYSDDRARPLRVPGHNLILARSPKLKALMRAQNPQIQRTDGKSLLIESNDRFLRSDGFWMAMQRLYGGPLLTPNVGMPHIPKNIHPLAPSLGTHAERFDEALGYAAAGHILEVPPVLKRGVEVASMLLNWDTIEKALDFALDGGLGPNWRGLGQVDGSPTYGPIVDIILHSALDFVCTHFPAGFQLDISAPDPQHNRRLPAMPQDRPPAQNPRLSLLKFGDHPGDHEGGKAGLNSSTSSILSRIFLNLPFQLLKHILENDHLGSFEGWVNQKSIIREKVMDSIVQERERRRVKALAYVQYNAKISDQLYDSLHMRESVILRDGSPLLVRHLEAT